MHRQIELDRCDHELDNRLKKLVVVAVAACRESIYTYCHRVSHSRCASVYIIISHVNCYLIYG